MAVLNRWLTGCKLPAQPLQLLFHLPQCALAEGSCDLQRVAYSVALLREHGRELRSAGRGESGRALCFPEGGGYMMGKHIW